MIPDFILMLTREDKTIPDAREVYAEVAAAGVEHVGCKDIGAPLETVEVLLEQARADGVTTYLEVVAETKEAMLGSARAALKLHPDRLIGGSAAEEMQQIVEGSGIELYPWAGQVIDHPSLLRGTIRSIADDARRLESLGVAGINLLAYRYDGDVPALIEAVRTAVQIPVICAGSINSRGQIQLLKKLGVDSFTIGTAVLDHRFVPNASLRDQISAVLNAANHA